MKKRRFKQSKIKGQHSDPVVRQIERDLNFVTGCWVTRFGITNWDLENHPNIGDVVLLINIRKSQWHHFNASERGYWSYVWDWCYHKGMSLKNKQLNKLEKNTLQAIYRLTKAKQLMAKKTTPKNKVAGDLPKQKEDHDTTAKGSSSAQTAPWV